MKKINKMKNPVYMNIGEVYGYSFSVWKAYSAITQSYR